MKVQLISVRSVFTVKCGCDWWWSGQNIAQLVTHLRASHILTHAHTHSTVPLPLTSLLLMSIMIMALFVSYVLCICVKIACLPAVAVLLCSLPNSVYVNVCSCL